MSVLYSLLLENLYTLCFRVPTGTMTIFYYTMYLHVKLFDFVNKIWLPWKQSMNQI